MLAKRIQQFDVESIQEQLIESIDKMYSFLQQSYQGLFCSVCDFVNHQFFDGQNQTIVYSQRFCRQYIDSSIVSLKYLNDLIIQLSNLVTEFTFSCNRQGFFRENSFTAHWKLQPDEALSEEIDDCIQNINEMNWLESCRNVCQRFSIVSFDQNFYSPYLIKFYLLNQIY